MKNLQLRVSKWNDGSKYYYLEDYCTTIKLSNSFSQIAAELNFELPYSILSTALLALNIEIGDRISLIYSTIQIFAGRVIDTSLKSKSETLTVTCYDYCWWVCKSNITKNFNNISVRSALEWVYNRIGATYDIDYELGSNGSIMIDSHLVKNKPASKTLYAIYNEVTKATATNSNSPKGVYYYMHTQGDGATLTITEADKYYSSLTIQPPTSLNSADGNLIDYEINESMQNIISRIDFYNTSGDIYDESKDLQLDDEGMRRFGCIIENIEVADDDAKAIKALAEGNKKLKEKGKPSEELTVTCFGDIWYKVAYGVLVKIPNTKYYDKFMYIVSSEWTWNKDGTFLSKLTLSPSKNQNLEDWTTIEEKQENDSSSSNGSSDLVNRIIAELKSHLGLAYKWAGKFPSDGGMDCSGYIAYVYNQFKNELEINGKELESYTYTMMNQGKDVTSDFPDKLRKCDIIFPTDHHVVAYIGNNKVIHEPQTGDVCKISDIWFDSPVKVIRVVPDSVWNSSSSDTVNDGKYSSKLVEFIKSWEGFVSSWDNSSSYGAIGYGTDASGTVGARLKAQGVTSCTESEAEGWLREELNAWATEVERRCKSKGATLNQYYFDCMVDICYQWGNQKWKILNLLCSGDISGAKSEIESLGYARRDNARCDILNGTYTLND